MEAQVLSYVTVKIQVVKKNLLKPVGIPSLMCGHFLFHELVIQRRTFFKTSRSNGLCGQ